MKKTALLILAILFLCNLSLLAQTNTKITGQVNDAADKPLSAISMLLNRAKDSVFIKAAVSDKDGNYSFVGIKSGDYFISTSAIGYQKNSSPAFTVADGETKNIATLSLAVASKNLQGVVIESKKPMVEVRADKMIVNVEGTINAVGNDGLELLRKSPGVQVDKDDNISMAGKNGVQIYIDGKPSPLGGADLANYLKSLQSSQIENIELITNPSAKYEAAGNAGIINIRLKKNKAFGTNGSVNAGYAIGTYGKYNAGINLNNRNKKTNIFGSYNFNHNLNDVDFNLDRVIGDTGFYQKTNILPKNTNNNFKVGLDYFIDKKSTLGFLINGNINTNSVSNISRTPIVYLPTSTTTKLLIAYNTTDGTRNNVNFNTNYKYTGKKGNELNIDADYGFYKIRSNQMQPNTYYNPAGTIITSQAVYNFIAPTNIDIFAFKTDYEQNAWKGKLGFGGKISYVKSNNHFERYDVNGTNKTLDVPRSNEFIYTENVNALYANYNRQLKGKMFQLGLRMENTVSDGSTYALNGDASVNTGSRLAFKRNYVDFFPSASITFNKNPMKQWSFSYSRRIDRPVYQDLNPFEFKLDEYTFQKGNTTLRPQYTNIVSLTNVYKYRLTTTLSYSHVNDIFTQLVDTIEKSKSFITKKNLATQDIVSLNVSYPFQKKWYSAFININSFFAHYNANFGGGTRNINLDVATASLYMQNSAKLGKGWTAELSGFYNSPSVWQGTFKTKSLWSIDGGFSKPILKNKGNFKISVSDMFRSLKWNGSIDFAGQRTTASGYGESRQFKVNFTYRFGSNLVKAARTRKNATEEESKRTQGGGGLGGQ
ncbi:MAG: outer membrane beta-barrel protein [Ferruginibacter sp.]|nr:outer membrane beta-barrel protein [Ferruginibacter sp.]